jgi:hypothetical protein
MDSRKFVVGMKSVLTWLVLFSVQDGGVTFLQPVRPVDIC